jgi:hypothetical protein
MLNRTNNRRRACTTDHRGSLMFAFNYTFTRASDAGSMTTIFSGPAN